MRLLIAFISMKKIYCVNLKHRSILASMQVVSEREEIVISRMILLLEEAGFIDGKYRDCIISSSEEDIFKDLES